MSIPRWIECTDEEYARAVANRQRINSNYKEQLNWYVNDLTLNCASQEFLDEQYAILKKLYEEQGSATDVLPPRSIMADFSFWDAPELAALFRNKK